MTHRTERLSNALTDLADTLAQIADADGGAAEAPVVRDAARSGADAARLGAAFADADLAEVTVTAVAEASDAVTHALAAITYSDDAERIRAQYGDVIPRVTTAARRALAEAVAEYQRATGAERRGPAGALRIALNIGYGGWLGISQAAARAGAGRTAGAITDRLPIMANTADRLATAIRHADA